MAIDTIEATPEVEFQVAEEKEPAEPRALPPNIEKQQQRAIETFRKTPMKIENYFGNMVLERVFPEFQLDEDVKLALSNGKQVRSNVTGEVLSPNEVTEHWILPRGEQVSKSTGAIYFPMASTRNVDLRNSFLFWQFENIQHLMESNDPIVPKFAIVSESAEKSPFEKSHIDERPEEKIPAGDEIPQMEITPPNIGEDWRFKGEFGATHDPEKVARTLTYHDPSDEAIHMRYSKIRGKRDEAELIALEPSAPHHPESLSETHKIVPVQTNTKVPLPIEGEGSTIAEKLGNELSPTFPKEDAARRSPEKLLEKYPPVLISQDFVILRTRKGGQAKFDFIIFAKGDSHDPKGWGWKKRMFSAGENMPKEITQWLTSLETRNTLGEHESGFPTSALSIQEVQTFNP